MFVQAKSQVYVQIGVVVFGLLNLIVFIFGIILRSMPASTGWYLCVISGLIGVVSCALEFLGSRFNKEGVSHKKLFKAFTVLFFIGQICAHVVLFITGVTYLNLKKIVDTMVEYVTIFLEDNSQMNFFGGVGVFCIILAIFTLGLIILATIHSGFVFFVKVLIATLSGCEILIAIVAFTVFISNGVGFTSAIPPIILISCAALGLVVVFKKNRSSIKCVSICYSVCSSIIAVLLIIALVVVIALRSSLPELYAQTCEPGYVDDNDQDECADNQKSLIDTYCANYTGSALEECTDAFDRQTVGTIFSSLFVSIMNIIIAGIVYMVISYVLPAVLSCVLLCVEKDEPALVNVAQHPPADPYNEAGQPFYAGGPGGPPPPGYFGPDGYGPYGPGPGAGPYPPNHFPLVPTGPGGYYGPGPAQTQAQAQVQGQEQGQQQGQQPYVDGYGQGPRGQGIPPPGYEYPLPNYAPPQGQPQGPPQGHRLGGGGGGEGFNGNIADVGYVPPHVDQLNVNPVQIQVNAYPAIRAGQNPNDMNRPLVQYGE